MTEVDAIDFFGPAIRRPRQRERSGVSARQRADATGRDSPGQRTPRGLTLRWYARTFENVTHRNG